MGYGVAGLASPLHPNGCLSSTNNQVLYSALIDSLFLSLSFMCKNDDIDNTVGE